MGTVWRFGCYSGLLVQHLQIDVCFRLKEKFTGSRVSVLTQHRLGIFGERICAQTAGVYL